MTSSLHSFPKGIICKAIAQYHDEEIDINKTTDLIQNFPVLHALVCVCVSGSI